MVSPVNAHIACCHWHMQTSFWLPALPPNPRQQAHIWATSYLCYKKPWQDDTGFSIFSFASLLVTAKVKTQYLPHILSKYYSGSKAWNRYLKWKREWRLLGKRDSQTHDTPFAILLPLLELDLNHWMFSHFLGTDFWYKCRVCSKDLMKHWNFPFHQKEGVGMISFPILARPSVW